MSSGLTAYRIFAVAFLLVTACRGADAASQGKQSGGQPGNGTSKTVHPSVQQCNGPTHQCGKPVKCRTKTVKVCGLPNRPGGSPTNCHNVTFQTC
jgi:hypothetical protein